MIICYTLYLLVKVIQPISCYPISPIMKLSIILQKEIISHKHNPDKSLLGNVVIIFLRSHCNHVIATVIATII